MPDPRRGHDSGEGLGVAFDRPRRIALSRRKPGLPPDGGPGRVGQPLVARGRCRGVRAVPGRAHARLVQRDPRRLSGQTRAACARRHVRVSRGLGAQLVPAGAQRRLPEAVPGAPPDALGALRHAGGHVRAGGAPRVRVRHAPRDLGAGPRAPARAGQPGRPAADRRVVRDDPSAAVRGRGRGHGRDRVCGRALDEAPCRRPRRPAQAGLCDRGRAAPVRDRRGGAGSCSAAWSGSAGWCASWPPSACR